MVHSTGKTVPVCNHRASDTVIPGKGPPLFCEGRINYAYKLVGMLFAFSEYFLNGRFSRKAPFLKEMGYCSKILFIMGMLLAVM